MLDYSAGQLRIRWRVTMETTMAVVIYHNPECGTSRNALAMALASGEEPTVIEYLKTGWTIPQLLGLFAAADLTPRSALRTTKSPAEELGLLSADITDDDLLNAMIEHPVLVNRPIVCSAKGVRLCRPSELVLGLLATPITEFIKEDDEVVRYSGY